MRSLDEIDFNDLISMTKYKAKLTWPQSVSTDYSIWAEELMEDSTLSVALYYYSYIHAFSPRGRHP